MSDLSRVMRVEALGNSPCRITITRMLAGNFAARMTFAPGMEPAVGHGDTVEQALASLALELGCTA